MPKELPKTGDLPKAADVKTPPAAETQTPAVTQGADGVEYIRADTYRADMNRVTDMLERLTSAALTRGSAEPQREAQLPAIEDVSEDELQASLEAAISEGDTKRASKLMKKLTGATEQRLLRQFDQRFSQLEGSVTARGAQIASALGTQGLKYYNRYRKEIDEFVSRLPGDARTDPNNYRHAHDFVVGQHLDEIIKEEREAALRKDADEEVTTQSGGSRRVTQVDDGDEAPLPAEAAEGLKALNTDKDRFAQSLGYESWDAYQKADATPRLKKKREAAEARRNAAVH